MGSNVQAKRFTQSDYRIFSERLQANLQVLTQLLERPGFGVGKPSFGAELELSLVNSEGKAQWLNQELLALANDPLLALELNRYNLEYNLSPVAAAGKPFSKMAKAIDQKLKLISKLGKPFDTQPLTIGILPTLSRRDISLTAMTDDNRYHVLNRALKKLRGHALEVDIDGLEPLQLSLSNLNIEGANTSFQVHLRVNPEQFANCYNAAQLGTAAALAISTNSPLLMGHRLWEETRVILFKQSVESRHMQRKHYVGPSRAGLGNGWVESSALELFEASVNDYPVLIPEYSHEDYQQILSDGGIPKLADLHMHHGSIWHWNRAIYDAADNGHLRIEMRALPSGPTSLDMASNAAFCIGITQGLASSMPAFSRQLDFSTVQQNFYAAAKHGLNAEFLWPRKTRASAAPLSAVKVIKKLLPLAAKGLAELAVEQTDIDTFLGIIEGRLKTRQTGARWQLKMLEKLEKNQPRKQALQQLLQH
jgi:gamma-glutamyl:cysteine ligase YbdK (ATP-grasp superfamily)